MLTSMTRHRCAAVLLLSFLPAVVACSSQSSGAAPTVTPSPAPSPTASKPAVPLVRDVLLGVDFLRPARWKVHRTTSSAHAGNAIYTAPGNRGRMYVERNDCAACIDQGLVMHGHRNNQPDPANALTSYFPTSQRAVNADTVAFTTTASKPYVADGKLTVTRAQGQLTGYVVVIVTLPATDKAAIAQILDSLRVS
jgi:hypothetical protein